MYFGITARLNMKDEYGADLPSAVAVESARQIAEFVLKGSDFKEANVSAWRDFIENNPTDMAAQYMSTQLGRCPWQTQDRGAL
jgi:hypothetical protein